MKTAVNGTLLGILALVAIADAIAADNWQRSDNYGELLVEGTLTASACRLAMDSAWQAVDMGNIDTARLKRPGDSGDPIVFHLQLKDCPAGGALLQGTRRGTEVWSGQQPAVAIAFAAPTDPDAPGLIGVHGASGLALKLEDETGQRIALNQRITPRLLSPGDNMLHYRIVPVRTPAEPGPGAWQAVINFQLFYN